MEGRPRPLRVSPVSGPALYTAASEKVKRRLISPPDKFLFLSLAYSLNICQLPPPLWAPESDHVFTLLLLLFSKLIDQPCFSASFPVVPSSPLGDLDFPLTFVFSCLLPCLQGLLLLWLLTSANALQEVPQQRVTQPAASRSGAGPRQGLCSALLFQKFLGTWLGWLKRYLSPLGQSLPLSVACMSFCRACLAIA